MCVAAPLSKLLGLKSSRLVRSPCILADVPFQAGIKSFEDICLKKFHDEILTELTLFAVQVSVP